MADDRNLQMVKEKLSRAIAAFEKFKGAQFDYWSEVKDANSVTECQEAIQPLWCFSLLSEWLDHHGWA